MAKITKQEKEEFRKYQDLFNSVEENVLSSIWFTENFSSDKLGAIVLLIKSYQNFSLLVLDYYDDKKKLALDELDVEALRTSIDDVLKKALKEDEYKFWDEHYKKFFAYKDAFLNFKQDAEVDPKFIEKFQQILSRSLNYVIRDIRKKYHYDNKSICKRSVKWVLLICLIIFGVFYYNKAKKYETYNFLNWKDFDHNWKYSLLRQDYGVLKKEKAVSGNPCNIKGNVYKNCYGTHAVSKIKLTFKPNFTEFSGACGVDKQCWGTVKFIIKDKDNNVLFETGVMNRDMEAQKFSVPVKGLDTLFLHVEDGGNGISCDHADWVDLELK